MAALPLDDNLVPTSAQKIDPTTPAPGATEWTQYNVTADGGDVAQGKKADAAVTDPTASGTLVSLLKGILTFLRISAAGLGKVEDAVAGSGDTGVAVLTVRKDVPAATADLDGDYQTLHTDEFGRLHTSDQDLASLLAATTLSNTSSTALADDLVVLAAAGTLWGFQGYIDSGASAGFVQLHDTTSQPADTAVPKISFPVAAGESFSLDFGTWGRSCATGITLVFSSTGPTLTAGGAFMFVDAQYEAA